ncbi:MAG: elongation factor Ts [Clostridia bacterium]|nr:elongation factor Ts [Clostridia bacterium]
MAITAQQVNELRKKTGIGMMECKKALVEANGDADEAIKILREKGLAVAAKKADRVAAEGVVDIMKSDDGLTTAILEVNSETDFVAKNASFKEFVRDILATIVKNKPANLEALLELKLEGSDLTVEQARKDKVFAIGENITIRRFIIIDGVTGSYIHNAGALAVVAKFETEVAQSDAFQEFAKNICMQIAAMNASYVCKDCVPAEVVENEKNILLAQISNDEAMANKPDAVKAKMVEGRINKFYQTACLVDQAYVKDDSITIAKYIEDTEKALGGFIKVVSFVKLERGEGIEKREDDFAAEIEKLVNG